jgi:hypothetical protein
LEKANLRTLVETDKAKKDREENEQHGGVDGHNSGKGWALLLESKQNLKQKRNKERGDPFSLLDRMKGIGFHIYNISI